MKKKYLLFVLLITSFAVSQEKKDTIFGWNAKGQIAFLLNQSSFSNWTSGGDNAVAVNMSVNYDFNYKKENLNWDNKIITSYGLSYTTNQGYRKTNDNFEYNSLLGIKSKNYWFFSFFLNFKTQYSRGYDYSKTPKIATSDLFSPAYVSLGPGMLWKKSDNLRINIAPATTRITVVSDDFSGQYGVEEGKNTNFGLGFNLSVFYKTSLMQNITMENIVALYADYLNNPQNIDIDYRMNVVFIINKYISTNITLHTIIDNNASSKVQFRELFGLGVNYLF